MRPISQHCAPTHRFACGMMLLFIPLLSISSGCATRPQATVTGCPLDETLIADLSMPARPPKVPTPTGLGHTNAQWLQSWEAVRMAIREDAARKAELRRQLEACR